MTELLVSVIVCTYNRGKYLVHCLESIKNQTYSHFEIIIVNGPSTDDTDTILHRYDNLKIIQQKSLNGLSYARNLGIAASNGDIIAFIDDDAVADKNWINYLVEGYSDFFIGGVGGLVYGPCKAHIQFDNGVIDKCGIPDAIRSFDKKVEINKFKIFMGTNCSFRKSVLYEVGGFDPYFRYYHDESELCVRIIKAGFQLIYKRDAYVIHDMVEGHNRKSAYDLDWTEIVKNVQFFTMKNFGGDIQSYTTRPGYSSCWWLMRFFSDFIHRNISFSEFCRIEGKVIKGVFKGYFDGVLYNFNKKNEKLNFLESMPDEVFGNSIQQNYHFNKSNLKIVLISQDYSKDCNGGICRYTYDLAHGLANLGNEVHIITKSETNRSFDFLDDNVHVHKIVPYDINFINLPTAMNISYTNLSYSYSVCLTLLKLIKNNGIQIIEAPLWDAEGFVFSLLDSVPMVVRLETPLYKVAEINNWEITKDIKFANWMEGETARRADKVIAISTAIGTLICDHHSVIRDNVVVSPLGIEFPDNPLFNPNNKKNNFNILFVGRLEKRKGIETLFRAIPEVIDKIPTATFTLVGSDTRSSPSGGSYKKYLLRNLNKRYHSFVIFEGFVSEKNLKKYYKNCDVFVAPSLYESFGLIYLEAMAWGKPVIGCNSGGIPEIIENGVTGFLIRPDDDHDLAEKIILLQDGTMRQKMGECARESVKRNFSIEKMVNHTLSVYNSIVGRSGKSSNPAKTGCTLTGNLRIDTMDELFDPRLNIMKDSDLRGIERTSLNRLCDISDWKTSGKICDIMRSLGEGSYIHRKSWEYAYCIYGLTHLGVVNPNCEAIAVGAGYERPLFYFANQIKKMVATDLYNNPGREGDPSMLTTPEKFAPFPYKKENLEVHKMNGTDLKFVENSFDFAFTLSSIEHFGSRENIKKAMSEIYRVLKPGGVLCLATELILNNAHHPEFFTLDELKDNILESTNIKFKMVGGDLDLRISQSLVLNPIEIDTEKNLNISPHIVLKSGNVIWTSVICFLQKEKINCDYQSDHLELMKKNTVANQEYYQKIMAIRYPKYMSLIKKYKPHGKILDIGCGFSDTLFNEYIFPSGYSYYCTDLSREVVNHMMNLTQSQGSDLYSSIGTIENLPWNDNFFDVVYACHILEHSTDIIKAFSEIKRVLKPDGILLFAVPCGYDDEPAHLHNREIDGWREDFQNNYWEIIESGQFDFNNNEFYGIAIDLHKK
jgi:glycosyltransferase involved in cell wall biosynthesis/GT2 family glycosyltransferase/SAM-dependent methyltransferase